MAGAGTAAGAGTDAVSGAGTGTGTGARGGASKASLLIAWWSVTGGSRALAEAATQSAQATGDCAVISLEANRVRASDLLSADAYLFVMPEMLGSMAGVMKDLFDRLYYDILGKVDGRAYASIVCAGSDGTGAQRQLDRIVTGWRLRRVAEPFIVCTHAQTSEAIAAAKVITQPDLDAAAEIGKTLAMGLAMGLW